MPVTKKHIYLYAAVTLDFEKALAAADVAGVPRTNVIGNFQRAWSLAEDTENLVIAVGGSALFALYYNPCGWETPTGQGAGRTPFNMYPSGKGVDAVTKSEFVNAAGKTALDTLKLAIMLTYYAAYGTFPHQFRGLPIQETPRQVCPRHAVSDLKYSFPDARSAGGNNGGVGVYANFTSEAEVAGAIQLGWKGVAATEGLGTPASPYTAELASNPTSFIAKAVDNAAGSVFWLSFWTVSWPSAGDTFYNAGHVAGKYVAEVISKDSVNYLPNYVIIDPEGYNTPASTAKEWQDWLQGWADGLHAVNTSLQPAFYVNQSQYQTYGLSSVTLPTFVAVSPIVGNKPFVSGNNIVGYAAYYASCPAGTDVSTVENWGGKFNTVQFQDSGVDCKP